MEADEPSTPTTAAERALVVGADGMTATVPPP